MHQRQQCVTKAGVTAPPTPHFWCAASAGPYNCVVTKSQRAENDTYMYGYVCDIEEGPLTEMKTEEKRSLIH